MMKFAFLLLLFLVYYIAGMYESPALMVVFLTQLLLMGTMLFLSFYLKKHLKVFFTKNVVWAERDRDFQWKLGTDNSGKLPVGKFVLEFKIFRQGEKSGKRKKVKANCDPGVHGLILEDRIRHCGIYEYRMDRLRVFDYLSLFSGKTKPGGEMEVVVFPSKYRMKIETETAFEGSGQEYRQDSFFPGSGYDEIRQIREYRDGDSIRHIHWNQTARTGQLWVKEYEEETKGQARLFLDLHAGENAPAPDEDDFYTLLYALVTGLLWTLPSVLVSWRKKESLGITEVEVQDDIQCRNLICLLYQTLDLCGDERENRDKEENRSGEGAVSSGQVMRLTPDLSWYKGNRLIFRFSGENLEEELADRSFRI